MSLRAGTFSIRAATVAGPGNSLSLRRHVYFGRAEAVLLERERIKRQRNANRRLQHQLPSRRKSLPVTNILSDLSNARCPLRLPLQLMVRVEAEVAAQV